MKIRNVTMHYIDDQDVFVVPEFIGEVSETVLSFVQHSSTQANAVVVYVDTDDTSYGGTDADD